MNNTSKHKCVGSVVLIPCEDIDPDPLHCRKTFNIESFNELINSVKKNGIIQPLLVKRINNKYQIISGERRLRAAILCDFIFVPCIIMNISDIQIASVSLLDNFQRNDIHFFDEAMTFKNVMEKYNISIEQLSILIGKSEKYIDNKISLLNLNIKIRNKIIENSLSEEYAKALLNIKNENKQEQILDFFIKNDINVYEIDHYVKSLVFPSVINNITKFKFNDINLFINTFNNTVDTMQKVGIEVVSEQYESEKFLEYVVRIHKISTSPVILSDYIGSA